MKSTSHFSIDKNFDLKITTFKNNKKEIIVKNKLAKYMNVGYYLVTPLLLGVFFGLLFDNLLKTQKLFFIIFFSFGIIGTFYNLYKFYIDERKNN